jgi:heat shock protein HslJ/uncharacterized membrane protein
MYQQPQSPVEKKDSSMKNIPSTEDYYRRLQDKLLAGNDFMASGNEPFWSLEIDFDKQMHFKTVNGFEMITPVPEGVKALDAPVVRYRAATEAGELIVQLAHRECINSMSGEKSAYSVTVDTKTSKNKDYIRHEGCGTYTSDYRLNDIWVLERVNKTILKREDFMKGLPQLELNLAQQKVFGHTGCNNLNGAAEVQGEKISFGRFITTRIACSNMDFESRYLTSLQQRAVRYKIDSGKLHLVISTDSVYTYRKID